MEEIASPGIKNKTGWIWKAKCKIKRVSFHFGRYLPVNVSKFNLKYKFSRKVRSDTTSDLNKAN